MKEHDPKATRLLRVGWTLVFLANLRVPLLFGWGLTDWGGRIGMFAAIGPLYLVGRESCARVRGMNSVIIWGGMLVALSQVYPMVHVFAGGFAFRTAGNLGLMTNEWDVDGALAGCIVTLLTGVVLFAIAAVAGLSYPIAKMMPDRYHNRHLLKSTHGLD